MIRMRSNNGSFLVGMTKMKHQQSLFQFQLYHRRPVACWNTGTYPTSSHEFSSAINNNNTFFWREKLDQVLQPLLSLKKERRILQRKPQNNSTTTINNNVAALEQQLQWIYKYKQENNNKIEPHQILTRDQYHVLLNNYLQHRKCEEMDHLLSFMMEQQLQIYHDDPTINPNIKINSWHQKPTTDTIVVTREAFHLVMRGWMKHTTHESEVIQNKTISLLNAMWELYNETKIVQVKPNLETYHLLLKFWSLRKKPTFQYLESAKLCTQVVLEDICHQPDTNDESLRPTLETFNYALEAWSRCTSRSAPRCAIKVLSTMKLYGLEPNITSIRHLIWTWVRSGHDDAEQQVKQLLKDMENNVILSSKDHHEVVESQEQQPHPTTTVIDCYNGLLSIYAKRPHVHGKAESVLMKLLKDYKRGTSTVKPDYLSFYTTISACCRIPDPIRAEKIYREMLHNDTPLGLELNRNVEIYLRVFTELLECVTNSSTNNKKTKHWAASHADELLMEMIGSLQSGDLSFVSYKGGPINVQLKVDMFNLVLYAWSRSGYPDQSSARAEAIIDKMKELKVPLNSETYTALLACNVHDAPRVHGMLMEIISSFEGREHYAFPLIDWFNRSLEAWSKVQSDEALKKSNDVFMKMRALHNKHKYLEPTTETFEYLMTTVAHQRSPSAAEYWLADILKRSARDPSLVPSTKIFNSVIFSWIWNKDPEVDQVGRVYEIYNEMQESFQCQPDQYTYQFMIQCLARSSNKDKALRARDLLWELQGRGIVPTTRIYNEILAACAFSCDYEYVLRKSIFVVAQSTFKKVLIPDEYTFGYFFQAAAEMGEDEVVAKAYQKCCQRGFSGVRHLREILESTYPNLLNNEKVAPGSLLKAESNYGIFDKQVLQGAMKDFEELQSEARQSRRNYKIPKRIASQHTIMLPEWPLD